MLSPIARLARTRVSTATLRSQHAAVAVAAAAAAAIHTTPPLLAKSFLPRTVLLDSDLVENFLKGSGPGGQKINKTSSAVQLKHIPTGIVVKYQDTRSREINRKMARRILQDRIEEMELGEDARTRVKAREKSKKKASAAKKTRRKYRALEEAKQGEGEGERGVREEVEERQEDAVTRPLGAGDTGKAAGG